ncbi:MAG: DUF2262 domain-containing protein [Opitutales bacterium]|nr:DUF2262 domain-containing protein [Opitutales bacterium]
MNHPTLGKISKIADEEGSYEAKVIYDRTEISVQLDVDDGTLAETAALAASLIAELKKFDDAAKTIIVNDLHETYNDNWRSYDEKQSDGTFKTITNPELSENDFRQQFTLSEIAITGNECVEMWYTDTGLFLGHGIFVQSLDGLDFNEAESQLFG